MSEIEEQAKAGGWNPNYKGENAKTAEQFIEDGKKIAPIVAERNDKLTEKVAELTALNQKTNDDLKEFMANQHKISVAAQKRGYDKAVADIEAKKLDAVEEGDKDLYKKLDSDQKKLEKPKDIPAPSTAPPVDPLFNAWHKENRWYKSGSFEPATLLADAIGKGLMETRKDLTGADFYKEVEKQVKASMPGVFEKAAPKLDTSENKPGGGTVKGYQSLSKEEKSACDSQVSKGYCTKEEWIKSYQEAYGG